MKTCLICKRRKSYTICKYCSINSFNVEECRQILANEREFIQLKKMYSAKYPEIKNLNTADFWNNKLRIVQYLKDQDGMTQDRVNIAADFLPVTAKRILDIGAGNGYLEELLSNRNQLKLYANDISFNCIRNFKKRFTGNFKVESIYKMRYKNNFFDAIFILEVLEHIPSCHLFKVLKKIYRILKKNGLLIVSVPMNEGLKYKKENLSGHVRDYTYPLISAELMLSGFRILDKKQLYAFSDFYSIKKLVAKIIKNIWKPNNIVLRAQKV